MIRQTKMCRAKRCWLTVGGESREGRRAGDQSGLPARDGRKIDFEVAPRSRDPPVPQPKKEGILPRSQRNYLDEKKKK